MDCPNEFTWAMYADGELAEAEAWTLRRHLTDCADCRQLTAALQEENRALVHALQHLDAFAPQAAAESRRTRASFMEFAAVVVGLAVSLRLALNYLTGQEPPISLEWLNPFRPEGQLNYLLTSIVYLFDEGGPNLMSLFNNIAILAVGAIVLVGVPRLIRRSTSAGLMLTTLLVVLACSVPSYAIDHRTGGRDGQVVVASGETIDDTLFTGGDSVIIEGTVNGDVMAFGRTIEIRGTVRGNVISCAQSLIIEGTVEGTVYGFAQNIRMRGQAARDLYGFGQNVSLERQGQVARNMVSFAQNVMIDGNAGLDLITFAQKIDVRGSVMRDFSAHGQTVSLLSTARVGRNVVAEVPNKDAFKIESGAAVGGKQDVKVVPPRPSQYATVWFYIRQILWLLAAFITGMLLFWLFPSLSRPPLETRDDYLKAGVAGFLATVATPVAALIIAITIIGLPVGLVSLCLWILGLYLAKIVIAAFVGRSLLASPATSLPIALLAGLIIVLIAVDLPFIGWLINFILTFLGLGAILLDVYRRFSRSRTTPALT